MKKELAVLLVEVCEADGFDAELYENYSGRGMYGKTTTGVVVHSTTAVLGSVVNNADLFVNFDTGRPYFSAAMFQVDNMGLDIIVY